MLNPYLHLQMQCHPHMVSLCTIKCLLFHRNHRTVECRHLLSITAAYRQSGKDRYSGSTCSNQRLQLCFWYFCCAFLIFRFWILCKINYNNVKYLFLQSTYCPTSVNIQWRCSFSLKAKRMKPSWQVRKLGLLIPIRIRLHNYSEDLTRWK